MIKYRRTTILFLFLLSLVIRPLRGKANKVPENLKRVVAIYLTKNVGDMIFATTVFRALKEAKPDTKMFVIGSKRNEETLMYNPDIDKYIQCPNSVFSLWKILREINADYGFLFTPTVLELSLLYLSNVPAIGVFTTENSQFETKTFKLLKKLCIQIPFVSGQNFANENLKLINPLGINSTNSKHR